MLIIRVLENICMTQAQLGVLLQAMSSALSQLAPSTPSEEPRVNRINCCECHVGSAVTDHHLRSSDALCETCSSNVDLVQTHFKRTRLK
ncbi:Ubiquitin-60S ribosomal protein L40 [Fusarium oxysporum f. sp. albedinis]|nr:Ubiquitin-60S ribosomal protein L40 [Fusarium oxysporum f. sp. albedinis]